MNNNSVHMLCFLSVFYLLLTTYCLVYFAYQHACQVVPS